MKHNKWLTGPAVLGLTVVMSGFALQAQPGNPPAGGPPPNQPGGGGNRPDWRNATPEQRQQWMQQMREQRVRELLTPAGFTDPALQAAVVAYVAAQDEATRDLRDKERQIEQAARRGDVADAQLATLLADYRAGIAAEKTRRAAAAAALDVKIEYSKKPRLDALLTTAGIVGDESATISGGRGMGGFGGGNNRGGRGGGQGGGGGRA